MKLLFCEIQLFRIDKWVARLDSAQDKGDAIEMMCYILDIFKGTYTRFEMKTSFVKIDKLGNFKWIAEIEVKLQAKCRGEKSLLC